MSAEYSYVGNELQLFLKATNWKTYWASRLRPFVRGKVLDVGAGIGATFDYLGASATRWTCLEPDRALCEQLRVRLAGRADAPRVTCGTLASLPADERFDTVMYVDVLEHIEHDREELAAAAARIDAGGSLIVLSPALPILFSPFDRSVGHFRRYTVRTLDALTPRGLRVHNWFFLDGLGVGVSVFARLAGRSTPRATEVALWDKLIVPVSRVTDAFTSRFFGRSLVMIWTKM
ncbi:MAG TPA: class I SAM-dependent methyltransferase [Polyangiaceae bacterium]